MLEDGIVGGHPPSSIPFQVAAQHAANKVRKSLLEAGTGWHRAAAEPKKGGPFDDDEPGLGP